MMGQNNNTQDGLQNAFDDCLNRLNAGQRIDECLRVYPQYAQRLRPLLELSTVVKRGLITNPVEASAAKDRVRATILAALPQHYPMTRPTPRPQRRIGSELLVAVLIGLVVIISVFIGLSIIDQPTVILTTTPTITATASPSPSATATITPSPTATTSATPTSTPSASTTALQQATVTTTVEGDCIAVRPDGWITYRVKAGDTLSGLAAATDSTIEEIMRVNCITDPRGLIVGVEIFLPRQPNFGVVATPDDGDDNNNGGNDDNQGGDDPVSTPDDDGSDDDDDDEVEDDDDSEEDDDNGDDD